MRSTHLTRASLSALLLTGACRHVPSELSLATPPEAPTESVHVIDLSSALTATLRGDPLARRAAFPNVTLLRTLPDVETLRRVADVVNFVERQQSDPVRPLQTLAQQMAGTEAVALTRGYRLGRIEPDLDLALRMDRPLPYAVAASLLPLEAPSEPTDALTSQLLAYLGDTPATQAQHISRAAAGWIFAGWLDGPAIDLGPVAALLSASEATPWQDSPWLRVITARTEPAKTDDDARARGLAALREATGLALKQSAADTAEAQADWADALQAATTRTGATDPIAFELARARDTLTPLAHDDLAAGGAILAISATRLLDPCAHAACLGLFDRTADLAIATRWSDDLKPLVAVWQVIALKRALDAYSLSDGTVLAHSALYQLADALTGTGAAPLRADALAQGAENGPAWPNLVASLGMPAEAGWSQARYAFQRHLSRLAEQAASDVPAPWKVELERIRLRMQP